MAWSLKSRSLKSRSTKSRSLKSGFTKSRLSHLAALLVCIWASCSPAAAASGPHYILTNDDAVPFFVSGVTFYSVGPTGLLTLQQEVPTGGSGIGGGFFSANRVAVLDTATTACVYASEAYKGDIVGIVVSTLEVGGSAFGSMTDTGATNGIGLALNAQYLYASFTGSSTIGTFQVLPGCSLTFLNDVSVSGLKQGSIAGMAIHGNIMIATYDDGSIESFDISNGTPVSNGDKQNSTAYVSSAGATYPNSIDITQDGHYALFGDTSTSAVVEVADISSGKLTPTVVYTLGTGINSSNIMLSPDETLLYITNTQGDSVSAAYFNATTGALTTGCTSGPLRNYVSSWSYLASLGLETTTGTGGVLYVAEFGTASGIAMIGISSSGGQCTLTELQNSPVADPNSIGLVSIAGYPPRSF
jgi:6-phosphogluconolactonase (cycloisomerase 2 family)